MTDIIVKLTETTPVVGKIDGKASEVSINAHNTSETSHTDIRTQLSAIDVQLAEKANKVPEAWFDLSLVNGWSFGTNGYLRIRKNQLGIATIVGMSIKPPTTIVNYQSICGPIPLDYTPYNGSMSIQAINGSGAQMRKFYFAKSTRSVLVPYDSGILNTDSLSFEFSYVM